MCLLVGFLHEFNIFLFKNTIFGSLIVICVWNYIFLPRKRSEIEARGFQDQAEELPNESYTGHFAN